MQRIIRKPWALNLRSGEATIKNARRQPARANLVGASYRRHYAGINRNLKRNHRKLNRRCSNRRLDILSRYENDFAELPHQAAAAMR